MRQPAAVRRASRPQSRAAGSAPLRGGDAHRPPPSSSAHATNSRSPCCRASATLRANVSPPLRPYRAKAGAGAARSPQASAQARRGRVRRGRSPSPPSGRAGPADAPRPALQGRRHGRAENAPRRRGCSPSRPPARPPSPGLSRPAGSRATRRARGRRKGVRTPRRYRRRRAPRPISRSDRASLRRALVARAGSSAGCEGSARRASPTRRSSRVAVKGRAPHATSAAACRAATVSSCVMDHATG
jgi:hypothetical protein